MDLSETIIPKSDQINAEDLLTGPRTFTVERVTKGNVEQPVNVHLVELPGRPYRPSKSMRRVLIALWSKDGATWTGKRLTLYRDPAVKFGGQEVGGIKISHVSDIDKAVKLSLTETRGKRAQHKVEPLPDAPPTPSEPTPVELADQVASALRDAATEVEVREWGNRAHARGLLDLSPTGVEGTLRDLVQTRLVEVTQPEAGDQS